MIICCEVEGLPPKKCSDKSMWAKELESGRLVELRRAVVQQLPDDYVFSTDIKLALEVHMRVCDRDDLDNLISGVCDGLMKAHGNANLCSLWKRDENQDIHPRNWKAIVDDRQVVSVSAVKIIGNDCYYKVTIEANTDAPEEIA